MKGSADEAGVLPRVCIKTINELFCFNSEKQNRFWSLFNGMGIIREEEHNRSLF